MCLLMVIYVYMYMCTMKNQPYAFYSTENLSRRLTTNVSQSSRYFEQYASYANDDDLRTEFRYCAQTAIGHPIAWFQVDLGAPYNITSVKIYYRKEDRWLPYRFKYFYLDVSNSSAAVTNTTQRTRCYTDNSTHYPDNIIELPCRQTARYIIVETTYDTPTDDPETGAVLEICEIQVFGYVETQFVQQTCICTNGSDVIVTIASIVLSVIIVLTGSVVNVLWWRRNKTLVEKEGLKENVPSQNTAYELSDLQNSGHSVRSPYAELGDLDKPNSYEDLHQYSQVV